MPAKQPVAAIALALDHGLPLAMQMKQFILFEQSYMPAHIFAQAGQGSCRATAFVFRQAPENTLIPGPAQVGQTLQCNRPMPMRNYLRPRFAQARIINNANKRSSAAEAATLPCQTERIQSWKKQT
jgi:hypothetical protein